MGVKNFELKNCIKSQLKIEEDELLDLITEIETLQKLVEYKMEKINEKQKNITILEKLNNM